jgi:hypothetical protein
MVRSWRSCSRWWPCKWRTAGDVSHRRVRLASSWSPLTLAMAIMAAKINGAIQWTCGGPRLVHAKPNSPMVSRGAARFRSASATVRAKRVGGAGVYSLQRSQYSRDSGASEPGLRSEIARCRPMNGKNEKYAMTYPTAILHHRSMTIPQDGERRRRGLTS